MCHLLAGETYRTGGMLITRQLAGGLEGKRGKHFHQGDYRSHGNRSSAIGKVEEDIGMCDFGDWGQSLKQQ